MSSTVPLPITSETLEFSMYTCSPSDVGSNIFYRSLLEQKCRFCPKRNVNKAVLLGHHRRPHEERVGYEIRGKGIYIGTWEVSDEVINVKREGKEQSFHELILVSGTVKAEGEAVADCDIANVETVKVPLIGENVIGRFSGDDSYDADGGCGELVTVAAAVLPGMTVECMLPAADVAGFERDDRRPGATMKAGS
nr:hypothetical protein TorRG33x02_024910 [Ipomoea batatas]